MIWLWRRHKLRRRYSVDVYRIFRRRQYLLACVFCAAAMLVTAFAMTHLLLEMDLRSPENRQETQSRVFESADLCINPAWNINGVTCAVTVKIGADNAFIWNTPAMTVADMLAGVGYTPKDSDMINVPLDAVVEDGMTVDVVHVTYEEAENVVAIPYDTVYHDIRTIPKGSINRISYGTDGVAKQLERRRFENGELVSTEVLSREVVAEPVSEVLERGIGGTVYGNQGAFRYSYYIDVTATAYGGYADTRYTYTGTVAKEGVIAVDPDIIPLGSKVYVKGDYGDYGCCSADDIGSGIKGYRIDIYMNASEEVMMEFGNRAMRVYILE
ncbi:MAG: G5 domain-containing protein [Clostridia bacterium]|nr:G5 domain-containing protein [Clostridia bacterium]